MSHYAVLAIKGSMEAIRFEKVHFSYEREDGENDNVFAESAFSLNGIDFSVAEGEFVAVLGHNGSGKSTLARLTNGLLTPSQGKITVLGLDATKEENLFEIRKQVGIVFQNPDNQMVASIVEDDVAFGPENVGIPREEIGERIAFSLRSVGMEEYRRSTPSRLSGGQKQRIAIAGVLALKPRVMILDESTAMLDPRGRKEVMDIVKKLNREEKMTVVLITHFAEEALLADRAIVMSGGNIVLQGKPEEVLKRGDVLEKYSLTLPRSVRICRGLQEGGLPVKDGLFAEDVAENIYSALQAKNVDFSKFDKMEGACTDSTSFSPSVSSQSALAGGVLCQHLSYAYNQASPFETYALDDISLQIPAGSFFGIIGHTGSGKSTFVQHLNALLKVPSAHKKYKEKKKKKGDVPTEKTILTVNGFDLTDKNTDFKQLRSKVGMVFQYPEHQLFAETVYEDVAFGLKNFSPNLSEQETQQAVKEALEMVGLDYESIKKRSPFDLSGGQKRRVAIAGVIVTKPEILVLDEPAAGLDPLGKEQILALLKKLHKQWCKTIVIVSHDMDEIAENCDLAAVFSDGKILSVAPPKSLFSQAEKLEAVGLDLPLTAKISRILQTNGVRIDCDFTQADLVRKILDFYKTGIPCTCLPEGGQCDA